MEYKSKVTKDTAPARPPFFKNQKRNSGWYGWFCCKHDDGKYYAVVAADAPMSGSTRYYVITKAMYDACDVVTTNFYRNRNIMDMNEDWKKDLD